MGIGGPIRVLVQLNSLELGGSQINALDLARAAAEFGVESFLAGPVQTLPPDGPSLIDLAAAQGQEITVFERPASMIMTAREWRRQADRLGVDLVHTYGTGTAAPAYWGPCVIGRLPLVMTVYEMFNDPCLYRAAPLIVGTKYQLEELQVRRGAVTLISPPVDLDRDTASAVDANKFVLEHALDPSAFKMVVVSRLEAWHPVKSFGIELAMRAVEALGEHNIQFIVVGTGGEEQRLRALSDVINQRLGHKAILMVGPLADPRPAYACADVVLGMGGSAARGMSFGRPVCVVGEHGSFELIAPETARELFSRSFWSAQRVAEPLPHLTAILRNLIADPEQRRSLGTFSREFAERHFGLREMSRILAKVYREAFASYGRRAWLADLSVEQRRVRRNRGWP